MNKFPKNPDVFYDSKIRELSNAASLIVRQMIEKDIQGYNNFSNSEETYKYLSGIFNKSVRTLRAWGTDWESSSGTQPTIMDFLRLVHITKSKRPIELLEQLISDASPEQAARNHNDLIKHLVERIRNFADTIEELSDKKLV